MCRRPFAVLAVLATAALVGGCERRARKGAPTPSARASADAGPPARPPATGNEIDAIGLVLRWRQHQESGGPEVPGDYAVAQFAGRIGESGKPLDLAGFGREPQAYGFGTRRWGLTIQRLTVRSWPGGATMVAHMELGARAAGGAEEHGQRVLILLRGDGGVLRIVSETAIDVTPGPLAPLPGAAIDIVTLGEAVTAEVLIAGAARGLIVLKLSGDDASRSLLVDPDLEGCVASAGRASGSLFDIRCAGDPVPSFIIMKPVADRMFVTRRVPDPQRHLYDTMHVITLAQDARVTVKW